MNGEKFITDSTIFFGTVLTSSYIPTTSSDPCEVGGEAFLYGFKLKCGQGIFPPDPSGRRDDAGAQHLDRRRPAEPAARLGRAR